MPAVKLPAKTEFKTLPFEVKEVDVDQGIVTGYLSTWDLDSGNGYVHDRIVPGAFKKTLMEAKTRRDNRGKKYLFVHLFMHDPEKPTGGYLDAIEDARGLKVAYELDISTNEQGHPNNQLATMEFSGSKRGFISEQSIGYEVIQSEIVEEVVDGKKIPVRNLIELRLVEGSGVVDGFAMNNQAVITGTKSTAPLTVEIDGKRYTESSEGPPQPAIVSLPSVQVSPSGASTTLMSSVPAPPSFTVNATPFFDMSIIEINGKRYAEVMEALEQKATICGNTSGPIGPRDEAWDGGKAKGQIWEAAANDDGSIKEAVAKKYFMVLDGDPQLKGSYGYPFWYVGADPHISVGAVKAIAAAIQGARGADAPSGLKSKVETLYSRINAKYPDDPELVPPWKSGGGGGSGKSAVPGLPQQRRKTFESHFADEQCEDLLEDWEEVFLCALTDAVEDAFRIGDQPAADVEMALDAFKAAVLSQFVAQGLAYGLPAYFASHSCASLDPDANRTDNDGDDSPFPLGWMSTRRRLNRKAGRALSALTRAKLADHADASVAQAKAHQAALAKATSAFLDRLRGQQQDGEQDGQDGTDEENEDEEEAVTPPAQQPGGSGGGKRLSPGGGQELKRGRAISAANQQIIEEHAAQVKRLAATNVKAVKTAANSLSQLWAEEGIGPAYADEEEETPPRKSTAERRRPERHAPPARPDTQPSAPDTEETDADMMVALTKMQALIVKT